MKRNAGLIAAAIGLLLALIGVGFVTLAANTPWHTDSNAYFEGLNDIRAELYNPEGPSDFKAASRRRSALQNRFATPKWFYADLGYSLLAWAALILAAAPLVGRRGLGGITRTTRNVWILLGLTALSLVLLTVGALAGPLQALNREQVPEWADSYGVVLLGVQSLMILATPLTAFLVFSPVLFRRPTGGSMPLVTWPPRIGDGLTTILYAAPLLWAGLLVASFGQLGGWATSISGTLLLWLLLNARALWIGQ